MTITSISSAIQLHKPSSANDPIQAEERQLQPIYYLAHFVFRALCIGLFSRAEYCPGEKYLHDPGRSWIA